MGGGGLVGLYSLRCHLRKVLGPVKLSEWMECFFRRPRSTFFHRGTWVCLFLFQIHSIILDCSKHSSTFQEPRIPSSFFSPPQPGSPTTTTLCPALTPAPTQTTFFSLPHHSWSQMDVAQKKASCFFSPSWGIWLTLDEGKPSYFRHTWLVQCAAI